MGGLGVDIRIIFATELINEFILAVGVAANTLRQALWAIWSTSVGSVAIVPSGSMLGPGTSRRRAVKGRVGVALMALRMVVVPTTFQRA